MCQGKIVKNIIGKDPSKDRGGYTEYKWEDSETLSGKGSHIKYLKGRKSKKKTPTDVIKNINQKFKV
jgi:hypothetical protein